MAAAFVQSKYAYASISSATTRTIAFTSSNTGGNVLSLFILWGLVGTPPTIVSVTDTRGNTWLLATSSTAFGGQTSISAYYVLNCGAGANTVTVTFSASASGVMIYAAEHSGVDSFDLGKSLQNTDTFAYSGNFIPIGAGETIVAAEFWNGNGNMSAGAGYVLRQFDTGNVGRNALEDRLSASAGSQQATFNLNLVNCPCLGCLPAQFNVAALVFYKAGSFTSALPFESDARRRIPTIRREPDDQALPRLARSPLLPPEEQRGGRVYVPRSADDALFAIALRALALQDDARRLSPTRRLPDDDAALRPLVKALPAVDDAARRAPSGRPSQEDAPSPLRALGVPTSEEVRRPLVARAPFGQDGSLRPLVRVLPTPEDAARRLSLRRISDDEGPLRPIAKAGLLLDEPKGITKMRPRATEEEEAVSRLPLLSLVALEQESTRPKRLQAREEADAGLTRLPTFTPFLWETYERQGRHTPRAFEADLFPWPPIIPVLPGPPLCLHTSIALALCLAPADGLAARLDADMASALCMHTEALACPR